MVQTTAEMTSCEREGTREFAHLDHSKMTDTVLRWLRDSNLNTDEVMDGINFYV